MDGSAFEAKLVSTDWNEEWKRLQAARQHADDPAVWDAKAKTFPIKHGAQTGYVERFLQLAGIRPGEAVLDMGCGTGSLATPLAQRGNRVIACDFSQGMLSAMTDDQRKLGVSGVEAHLMSWSDDWDAHGIREDCVDVAIASRSIATDDLRSALAKLDRVARRRACITLPSGPSPRADEHLLRAAGLNNMLGHDFLYAFNILASCGARPEVAYIPSDRFERFDSPEDARTSYAEIAQAAARGQVPDDEMEAIPQRIHTWLEANLVEDETGFHLHEPRQVIWAFIAWEPHEGKAF